MIARRIYLPLYRQGFIAQVPVLLLIGCTVWGGSPATPEQLAHRMTPLKSGAHRSTVVKPAPGGTLVIYEDILPQQNPNEFEIGYAYVALEPLFGWRIREGGNAAGTGTRPLWVFGHAPQPASSWSMVVGKVRDPRVTRITAVFSNGQAVQDVIVNGLFGVVLVPSGLLCQLDLWDAHGRQIESYDYKGSGGNLFELAPVLPETAKQACW